MGQSHGARSEEFWSIWQLGMFKLIESLLLLLRLRVVTSGVRTSMKCAANVLRSKGIARVHAGNYRILNPPSGFDRKYSTLLQPILLYKFAHQVFDSLLQPAFPFLNSFEESQPNLEPHFLRG
ncbi:unnamed protein product [Linum tenue]|uniref:Uncharacterized protein n=1 Tax=Linum tenue TaxID=586396 RepID=A0AAV0RAE3_9ROSI|nr:unnamed protein product [Linum tenue]